MTDEEIINKMIDIYYNLKNWDFVQVEHYDKIINKFINKYKELLKYNKHLALENQALYESINLNDDNFLANRYKKLKEDNVLFPLYKNETKRLIDYIDKLENENFNLKEKEIINKHIVPEEKNFYDYYGIDKNNEVKEAIEDLKLIIEQDKEELPYSKESLKNKQALLNYIAKLKKEIEELKERNKKLKINFDKKIKKGYISKELIKEIIKANEEQAEEIYNKGNIKADEVKKEIKVINNAMEGLNDLLIFNCSRSIAEHLKKIINVF